MKITHLVRLTTRKGGFGRRLRRNGSGEGRVPSRKAVSVRHGERERRLTLALRQAMQLTPSRFNFSGLEVSFASETAWGDVAGGDFCDVFPVGHGEVALVLGDVCGHGLPAARYVPEIKFALRAFLSQNPSPEHALSCLNDWLCSDRCWAKMPTAPFTTAAVVVLHEQTGLGACAVAGADAPLLLRPLYRPEQIGAAGTALGVLAGQCYENRIFRLGIGDLLLLTTDGITEARQQGTFLGVDGSARLATEAWEAADRAAVCRAVMDGARRFAGGALNDDASILAASRGPAEGAWFDETFPLYEPAVRTQQRE